jgi:CubicO group peptidase (beta-lactamase class C family)
MRCGTVCALKTPVIKCCHGPRIHPIRGRIAPSLFALTLFVLTLGAARATEPPSQPAIQPPGADSLEAVVFKQTDDTLGGMVRAGRTSFAAALLVQQGRLAFAKAYGVEGPDAGPFSIDSTQFDLNSVAVMFCSVAIAQLIDRGAIKSIDDPVNLYLKHFKLPAAFGHEVTIREVATHSAGFDLQAFRAGALDANPAEFFKQRFPGYFRNTGHLSAYDSYGPKLLAYLVSEVSDEPFPQYVEESILAPLGMQHTYLTLQPKPVLHRVLAFQPKAPANQEASPPLQPANTALLSGITISTMSDMAKFVAALLGPAPDQLAITQPMRDTMFQILQTNGAGGSAHGLLFDAERIGKKTLYVHGGLGPGIVCMMALDVPRQAGIFYCYGNVIARFNNVRADSPPTYEVITGDMLKPLTACAAGVTENCREYPPPHWQHSWDRYLGDYVEYARHHKGFSTLRTLLHPTYVRISRGPTALALDGRDGFVEIAPGIFGSPQYPETVGFIRDASTGKTVLSVSNRPSAYERPTVLENPKVLPILLAVLVLIAVSGGLIVVLPRYGIGARARLAAFFYCAVVGSGVATLFGLRAFGPPYFNGVAWPLNIVRCCAFATIPACMVLIYYTLQNNRALPVAPARGARLTPLARFGRLHLSVLCASSVLLVLALLTVHLISFSPIL